MNFSHPAILQNQKLLARQFLDICNNFLNIQTIKLGLSTIVTQLNGDFSKIIENTNIASQKAHALEKWQNAFQSSFSSNFSKFLDNYHCSKGTTPKWTKLVISHCLLAEKLLQSLGSECVKLSDHIDVVATCANRHKEEIQNIKTLLKTNSPPKELSSAVSALSQEINENWDKIKNPKETFSVLPKI